MIPLLVDEENCCTSWSRPGKKTLSEEDGTLREIALYCIAMHAKILLCSVLLDVY